jgi:hypothetical protein
MVSTKTRRRCEIPHCAVLESMARYCRLTSDYAALIRQDFFTNPLEVCAPERGTGAPLGMRPRRCAQARDFPNAKATCYRVRLRPVSRRPVCGSRRIAPRFANVDRSLQRPFPHWRFAYRVRGASPRAGRTARRKRGPMYGDLTREVRLDSTS